MCDVSVVTWDSQICNFFSPWMHLVSGTMVFSNIPTSPPFLLGHGLEKTLIE